MVATGKETRFNEFRLRWGTWRAFVVVYAMIAAMQMAYFSYIGTMMTSIERQFGFSSSQSGVLLGSYDVVRLPFLLVLPYVGRQWHLPRTFGFSMCLSGLMIMIVGSTRYMVTSSTTVHNNFTASPRQQFCQDNTSVTTHNMMTSQSTSVFAVLYAAMGIIGACQFAKNTMFYSFLYDNSPSRMLPLIFGFIMFIFKVGSMTGYALATWCNQIHTSFTDSDIDPSDPNWVGAWWLGFFIIGASMAGMAPLIALFPRRLSGDDIDNERELQSLTTCRREELHKPDVLYEMGDSMTVINSTPDVINEIHIHDEKNTGCDCTYECNSVRGYLKMMSRLIRNRMFMLLMCASISLAYYQGGFSFFHVKYYENQFRVPAYRVSLILGFGMSLVGGLAAVLGGLVSTRWKFTFRGIATMCAVCVGVGAAVSVPSLMISCHTTSGATEDRLPMLSMTTSCNRPCNCSTSAFTPVYAGNVSYFSACHAGCHTSRAGTNHSLYENCDCTASGKASTYRFNDACHIWLPLILVSFIPAFANGVIMASHQVLIVSEDGSEHA